MPDVSLALDGIVNGQTADATDVKDAFTTLEDAVNNLDAANLVDSAVTTAKIAAAGVTTAKLADGAVTIAKASGLSRLIDIITFNNFAIGDNTELQLASRVIAHSGKPVAALALGGCGVVPSGGAGADVQLRIYLDGVLKVASPPPRDRSGAPRGMVSAYWPGAVAAGNHTWELKAWQGNTPYTFFSDWPPILLLFEQA